VTVFDIELAGAAVAEGQFDRRQALNDEYGAHL
jgi:hypothetical protein